MPDSLKRKDGEALFVVMDVDGNAQPLYGPFPSEESADAFGVLLGDENHDYHVEKLRDPEPVRLKIIERLARYENAIQPRDSEAK